MGARHRHLRTVTDVIMSCASVQVCDPVAFAYCLFVFIHHAAHDGHLLLTESIELSPCLDCNSNPLPPTW